MIFFFSFLFNIYSFAQINRVSNGSFEAYSSCPTFWGQPAQQQVPRSIGWLVPTVGSSDYFNVCATIASGVCVPYNSFDYQQPYDGNAYVGICVLEEQNYREYIQTRFTRAMIAGNQYEVKFRVSLAAASSCSASSIGAFISDYQVHDYTTDVNLKVVPQIENPPGNYLGDSIGWTLISGIYTATGGEQYITIGNFHDSLISDANPPGFRVAYYFIDDVEVISLSDEQLLSTVFTPNGDGTNDIISFSDFGLETVDCQIYNRWGNLVASITNINDSWDGGNCEDGVYYYILKGTEENRTEIFQKGFIQLLR